MSVFRDHNGFEWRVGLDAFLLADAKKDAGVDLADLSAGGWWQIETDAGAVGRVLAVICGEEMRARKIDSRAFAKGVRGAAIESGRKALLDEGADFFPQSEWSAIRANLEKRKTSDLTAIQPMLAVIAAMPEGMRHGAIEAMKEAIRDGAYTASQTSPAGMSAGGRESIPLTPATDSPVSVV